MSKIETLIEEYKSIGKIGLFKFTKELKSYGYSESDIRELDIKDLLTKAGFVERVPGNWNYKGNDKAKVIVTSQRTIIPGTTSQENVKKTKITNQVVMKPEYQKEIDENRAKNNANSQPTPVTKPKVIPRKKTLPLEYYIGTVKGNDFYHNHKHEFKPFENWMRFFIAIGKFMALNPDKNFFVSFYNKDIVIPLIEYGFAKKAMDDAISKNGQKRFIQAIKELTPGSEVFVKANGLWQVGKFNGLTKEGRFSIETYDNKKHSLVNEFAPDKVSEKVRLNTKIKTRYNKIIFNDSLSMVLNNVYSESELGLIKGLNDLALNVIGGGLNTDGMLDEFHFVGLEETEDVVFGLRDFVYEAQKNKENQGQFKNVNRIKTNGNVSDTTKGISLFAGSSAAISFYDTYQGRGNIFFDDRTVMADTRDGFLEWLIQGSIQADIVTSEFHDFMAQEKVQLPKGVEIYVWNN